VTRYGFNGRIAGGHAIGDPLLDLVFDEVPPGVTAVRVEGEEQPCRAWRRSDI
jgi:hypothetical protein